jgi:hypothetical protein
MNEVRRAGSTGRLLRSMQSSLRPAPRSAPWSAQPARRLLLSVSIVCALGLTVLLARFALAEEPAEAELPTPQQLWQRVQKELPPFSFTLGKDEIVPSDFDPAKRLRRLEFAFVSQKLLGEEIRHHGVIFIPVSSDTGVAGGNSGGSATGVASYSPASSPGSGQCKVVIVGSLEGRWRESFLCNYGQRIATETGHPTMILPVPGDTEARPNTEYDIRPLIKLASETQDPIYHHFFRLAIPYLRGMEVFAKVLRVDEGEIRAVVGGHSKRATAAYTAAAIRPENVAGIVFMGNENVYDRRTHTPLGATSLYLTQRFVRCPVLYVGVTNESGYAMFNINKVQAHMDPPWTLEVIPNYRHASESEKMFLAWPMWVAHVFDGRPVSKIVDPRHEETDDGTRFSVRIDSPNKIIIVSAWYVYCDDVPYWRDLMWYPMTMRKQEGGLYTSYLPGKMPDAWLVEVQDMAGGLRGYVTSLPMDLTGKPAEVRQPDNGLPRLWRPKKDPAE